MKAYVVTTGTVFGLLTVAHTLADLPGTAPGMKDPWFILITLIALALSLWAWRLLKR